MKIEFMPISFNGEVYIKLDEVILEIDKISGLKECREMAKERMRNMK